MKIGLRSKGDARCPYCHDQVTAGEARTCGGCKTTLHAECADELTKCPTMGCGRSLGGRSRRPAVRATPVGVVGVRGGGGGGFGEWWEDHSRTVVGVVVAALVFSCLYFMPEGSSDSEGFEESEPTALALPAHHRRVHAALGCRFELGRPGYVDMVVTRWRRKTPLKLLIPIAVPLVPVGRAKDSRPVLMTSSWFEKPINGIGRYPVPAISLSSKKWTRPPGGVYAPRWASGREIPWRSEVEALLKTLRRETGGRPPPWPGTQVAVLAIIARRTDEAPDPMPTPSQMAQGEAVLRIARHELRSGLRDVLSKAAPAPRSGAVERLVRRFANQRPRTVDAFRVFKPHLADARVQKLLCGYLRRDDDLTLQAEVLAFLRQSQGLPVPQNRLWRLLEKERHRVARLAVIESLLARGVGEALALRLAYQYDRPLSREFNRLHLLELSKAGRVPEAGVSLLAEWKARKGKIALLDMRLRVILREVEKTERAFVAGLLEGLGDDVVTPSAVRQVAARIGAHPDAIRRLKQLARAAKAPGVRGSAIDMLATVPEAKPLGLLIQVVQGDSQRSVRIRALRYRGPLSCAERAKLWEAAARNDQAEVRGALLDELRRHRTQVERQADATTRQALLRLANDKERWIRRQAVVWVFRLRMPEAVELVRRVLAGKKPEHVAEALRLVPLLAEQYRYSRQAALAKRLIVDAARGHRSANVRDAALASLVRFGGYTTWLRDLLLERLRKDAALVVQRRALALAGRAMWKREGKARGFPRVLEAGLEKSRSPRVREYAADRIRLARVTSLKKALRRVGQNDAVSTVRARAFRALAGWDDGLALDVLQHWLRTGKPVEKRQAVKLLAAYYPRPTPRIRTLLEPYASSSDGDLRAAIAKYLKP